MKRVRSGRRSGLSRFVPMAGVAVLGLALAGCGTMRRIGVGPAAAGAPPANAGRHGPDRLHDAIADLNRGDAPAARRELVAQLRRQPGDAVARQLLAEIDTDPRVLLGSENYSYTLHEGESLSTVAQRALGNPMLFYALARYNNIAVPTSVAPGQTIQIPGRRPTPPAPRPEPRPSPPRTPRQPAPEAPAPAPQAAPRTNPALAARLRGQGLAALSAGAIDRAVALLRQALAQDPGNAVIRNDLGRALRIQGTVRARR